MNGNLRVGNLFGIPFFLNISWFFVLALTTLNFGSGLAAQFPGWGGASLVLGLGAGLLLFSSVLLHELGHSCGAELVKASPFVDESTVQRIQRAELNIPLELSYSELCASTVTDAGGFYAILGLDPGTYDVFAATRELEGRVEDLSIAVGSATVVDVLVE